MPCLEWWTRTKLQTEKDVRTYRPTWTSLPVTADRTEQIQEETNTDETMKELKHTIQTKWPENRKDCPENIKDFWNCRPKFSVVNDIVMKGNKYVILLSLHKYMLPKIHEGHLGEVKRKLREVM